MGWRWPSASIFRGLCFLDDHDDGLFGCQRRIPLLLHLYDRSVGSRYQCRRQYCIVGTRSFTPFDELCTYLEVLRFLVILTCASCLHPAPLRPHRFYSFRRGKNSWTVTGARSAMHVQHLELQAAIDNRTWLRLKKRTLKIGRRILDFEIFMTLPKPPTPDEIPFSAHDPPTTPLRFTQ